jgi:hypothetical protein
MSSDAGHEKPSAKMRYRILAVSSGAAQEKVLKVFDDYSEAQAFARFVQEGGAFVDVRVEGISAHRRAWDDEDIQPIPRPGGFTKTLFAIGLLVCLGCGGALGTFIAMQLELKGRLFVYCICGFTLAGALPAYWVMNTIYGAKPRTKR